MCITRTLHTDIDRRTAAHTRTNFIHLVVSKLPSVFCADITVYCIRKYAIRNAFTHLCAAHKHNHSRRTHNSIQTNAAAATAAAIVVAFHLIRYELKLVLGLE